MDEILKETLKYLFIFQLEFPFGQNTQECLAAKEKRRYDEKWNVRPSWAHEVIVESDARKKRSIFWKKKPRTQSFPTENRRRPFWTFSGDEFIHQAVHVPAQNEGRNPTLFAEISFIILQSYYP